MLTCNEAVGLVFQEAAAAGVPAIGTRLNAIPEIIDDGRTGVLVSPGNVPELITALESLLDDAALRERLGRAARAKIEQEADPHLHRARLVALIKQVSKYG